MQKHSPVNELPTSTQRTAIFASQTLLALCAFALVNLAYLAFPEKAIVPAREAILKNGAQLPMSHTFTGWAARAFVNQRESADVVLLGSSQMGSAVFASDAQRLNKVLDCLLHRKGVSLAVELEKRLGHPVSVFNWSLGGEMVSDAYMISKSLLVGNQKPKLVVIGVSPRDFIDNSLQYAGSTEPFHFFSPYVDLGNLSQYAFPDLIDHLAWALEKNFPIRKLRDEKVRALTEYTNAPVQPLPGRQFLRTISGGAGDVKLGEWVITANIPNMLLDNTKEYQSRFRDSNPAIYGPELKFFDALLAMMKKSTVRVLVVGMPSLKPNRVLLSHSFWQTWRSNMMSLCKTNDANWIDLTDSSRFDMYDFLDTVHMNAAGGAKLFNIVADTIAGEPQLADSLNHTKQERSLAGTNALPQ